MGRTDGRDGYALLAVLWMCAGITALCGVVLATARTAVASSRNRVALAAASWSASACLAQGRAVVTEALLEESGMRTISALRAWGRLDRILEANPAPRSYSCQVAAVAVGSRLDVNRADVATLARLYRGIGVPDKGADSAALALVSSRPFVDERQLRLALGDGTSSALGGVLSVEPGPIAINRAPAQLLALLPGFTAELVDRVIDARRRDAPVTSFLELSEGLSADGRDSLARVSALLPALITFEPRAWVITSRSTAGRPPVTAGVEVRLTRSGARTIVTRRKAWVQ